MFAIASNLSSTKKKKQMKTIATDDCEESNGSYESEASDSRSSSDSDESLPHEEKKSTRIRNKKKK